MTAPAATGYRAEAKLREVKIDPERPHLGSRHVPGWQCPCGANQGPTVLATIEDAQNAADMHTRQAHRGTFLTELSALAKSGGAVKGATVVGDAVTYAKQMDDGRYYLEMATGARFVVDHESRVSPYADGATRPE